MQVSSQIGVLRFQQNVLLAKSRAQTLPPPCARIVSTIGTPSKITVPFRHSFATARYDSTSSPPGIQLAIGKKASAATKFEMGGAELRVAADGELSVRASSRCRGGSAIRVAPGTLQGIA